MSQDAPWSHRANEAASQLPAPVRALMANPNAVLADLAPALMQHRLLNNANASARNLLGSSRHRQPSGISQALASLGRAPTRLLVPSARTSSHKNATDLAILEQVDELLSLPIPTPSTSAGFNPQLAIEAPTAANSSVSLLDGFRATTPASSKGRIARRKRRAHLGESHLAYTTMGYRGKLDAARGMMADDDDFVLVSPEQRRHTVGSGSQPSTPSRGSKPRVRKSMAELGYAKDPNTPIQTKEELEEDAKEIEQDRHNIQVRRTLIMNEIEDVNNKMAALEKIKDDLKKALLSLREEELELADEIEGVNERLQDFNLRASKEAGANGISTSRRRKGPAFLPSEHDTLPPNVAFMTLHGHAAPIAALDFSEPYGMLVTASTSPDESIRLWDLTSGEERGRLRGHTGPVKCLQVESTLCVTGGTDGLLKIWDLEAAERLADEAAMAANDDATADDIPKATEDASCMRTLEAHTKDVTCLYFDGNCLVTGSSDKTLRQWDLNTGQAVITMDILWAISNSASNGMLSEASPPTTPSASRIAYASPGLQRGLGKSTRRLSSQNYFMSQTDPFLDEPAMPEFDPTGSFSVPTPAYADGSWDLYQDFVGGVQFWGYALASGSADGCVRMWDMRTGQNHRTLVGHTLPVTCLQFDETHLISGSLDKSIRIWDLRTGKVEDTIRFDGPITALQFDSRKIVAAAGENAVRTYNRTTMQHDSLVTNGHTKPAERLRFMDRYMTSGAKDCTVKIWSLG